MRFDHIGGLDMAWRALAGGQILVEQPPIITPESVAAMIESQAVEVLAATPSFLNLLLLSEAHRHTIIELAQDRSPRRGTHARGPRRSAAWSRCRARSSSRDSAPAKPAAFLCIRRRPGLILRAENTGYDWKIIDGELWVKSPGLALGYLSGMSDAFGEPGWFRTGDAAELLDDGSLRVVGRLKELINVGGEKVLPAEVEGFLLGHPLIADCRVMAGIQCGARPDRCRRDRVEGARA